MEENTIHFKYTIHSEKSNSNMLSKFIVYNPRFQKSIIYSFKKHFQICRKISLYVIFDEQ